MDFSALSKVCALWMFWPALFLPDVSFYCLLCWLLINHFLVMRTLNTHLGWSWLTPRIFISLIPVSDLADELIPVHWREVHILGQMEAPVLFEGQVGLPCAREFHSILQKLDCDVRGVEATHMANQDVFLPILSWVSAVNLDLGRS